MVPCWKLATAASRRLGSRGAGNRRCAAVGLSGRSLRSLSGLHSLTVLVCRPERRRSRRPESERSERADRAALAPRARYNSALSKSSMRSS